MTDQTRPCTIGGCNAPRIDDVCFAHGFRRLIREIRWSLRHAMGHEPEMPQFGPAVITDRRFPGAWFLDCPTCESNLKLASRSDAEAAKAMHGPCTPGIGDRADKAWRDRHGEHTGNPRPTVVRSTLWQPWEDQILRSSASADEVRRVLPHRTIESIRKRRDRMGNTKPCPAPWTELEDRTLLSTRSNKQASHMLPGRTEAACETRRRKLRDQGVAA